MKYNSLHSNNMALHGSYVTRIPVKKVKEQSYNLYMVGLEPLTRIVFTVKGGVLKQTI